MRALVGGRSYADSQFNRAIAAHRQPGSAFKPFVYLAALEQGLTPDTVREDRPIDVRGWRPQNYSKEYYGPVTLETALSHSLNTVAVRLALEVGPQTVARTARRLGIASKLAANASIALGTSEVTLLEARHRLCAVRQRRHRRDPACDRARAHQGRQDRLCAQGIGARQRRVAASRADDEPHARRDAAHRHRAARLPGWPAAGKTGTSQDFRDAWFIGYTGRLVAGVWIGNDDNSPTRRASGSTLPVEIWNRFMRAAHEGMPVAGLPGAVEQPSYAGPPPASIEEGPVPPAPVGRRDDAPLDNWFLDRLFRRQ